MASIYENAKVTIAFHLQRSTSLFHILDPLDGKYLMVKPPQIDQSTLSERDGVFRSVLIGMIGKYYYVI
jgi:hypothetical protein